MNRFRYPCALVILSLMLLSACSAPQGQPQKDSGAVAPSQISDFATLYAQNCAGCHGEQGGGGAAIALANPVYLAIVDKSALHRVIANGIRGTSMPAFAQRAGGMLTDRQIDVITSGIFSHWGAMGFSTEAIHLRMRQKLRGMSGMANSFMEHIAHRATVLKAREGPRAAPSPTIHFWRSSAIKGYVRS